MNKKKKAISETNSGNDAYKNGIFSVTISHYTKSILHRTDFKPSYINRGLMYLKLKQCSKSILDCSMCIAMLKSNALFKAYLRRGNAYKLQNDFKKLKLVKLDLDFATKIESNDGAAKKNIISDIKTD